MPGLLPDCFGCIHMRGLTGNGWSCDAFDQIPVEIMSRGTRHAHPIDGDGGIRFEAKKTPAEAGYEPISIHDHPERCDNCALFVEPNGCRLILGRVSPLGWCPGWRQLQDGIELTIMARTDSQGVPRLQLYVDLDGVLADFDAGYEALSGRRPGDDRKVDWKLIEGCVTPGFYARLPMMPDARTLWDAVRECNPTILTGLPRGVPGAEDDKRAWVAEHLGPDVPVICCASRDKSQYAEPGDILIDDWEEHRSKWEDAGGRWITHTSAEDSIRQLKSLLGSRRDAGIAPAVTVLDSDVLPAAGVMIVTQAGKVLLLRRSDNGQWAFPGGKIEDGESAEETALRECEEEIGRRPEIRQEWTRRRQEGVDFTTYLAIVPDEFEPQLNEEHTEFRWLPIEDLASGSMHYLSRADAQFEESDHPRDEDGKFKSGSGQSAREIPFEKNPKVGWWRDKPHVDVYHGTHERHLKSILENGISHKDPKTGMVSVTLDPNTAHGYAAMSGEGNFRRAGTGARHVPNEERVVLKYRVPRDWIEQHVDPRLGGNLGEMHEKMSDPVRYQRHVAERGPDRDAEYYGTSELRFNEGIPPEFYAGHMRRSTSRDSSKAPASG